MRLLAVLVLFALAAPGAMGLGLPDPPAAPAEVWLQPTLLVPRPLAVVPDGVVLALPEVPAVPRPPAVPAPTDPIPVEEERALHATLPVPSEPQRPGAPEPSAATAFPRSDPVPPAPAPVPAVFVAEVAAPPPAPARAAAAAADAGLPPADAAGAAAALGLLVLALYVRLAPSAALASPARQRLAAHLACDPGCTAGTLARALGLDYKTALHHLRVLRRAGSVMVLPGAQPRYFLAGALPSSGMTAAVVLRARSARRLRAALEQGPVRAADLARGLGLSETTVSVQLRRLAGAGLAARAADGRWAAA